MSRRPPMNRIYEGPARIEQQGVFENNIFDGRGMPGGSVANRLTRQYGPEGTGWGIEAEQYADENSVKDALHAPEFELASEAMRNWFEAGRYQLDDGTDMRGKVQRYVREPDMVNVVIYPDGDMYAAKTQPSDY